jgi:hypothetical protein
VFPPSVKYHLPRVAVVGKPCTVTLVTDARRLHVSRYSSAIVSVTSHLNDLIRRPVTAVKRQVVSLGIEEGSARSLDCGYQRTVPGRISEKY